MPSYTSQGNPNPPLPVRPDYPKPEQTGWTKRAIDGIAAQVAAKLRYEPGADLEPIVEELRGKVVVGPVDETGSTGFLQVDEDGTFVIALSPLPGENRNRFTIAHELGHYFLHAKIGKKKLYATRQAGSRVEWEANWFASSFLMPADAFMKAWQKHNGPTARLHSSSRSFASPAAPSRFAPTRSARWGNFPPDPRNRCISRKRSPERTTSESQTGPCGCS